jgi:hypothetical protein
MYLIIYLRIRSGFQFRLHAVVTMENQVSAFVKQKFFLTRVYIWEINEGKCMNKYTLEKTEGPITDGQSRDTGKIGIGNLSLDN